MPVPLEQFVKHLEDSGILAGDTLKDFIPPKASPKDAEELLRELMRQKKLTKFQAEQVWQGKGRSLVLGNYLLLEKIGQGGMGQVFKAGIAVMERIVALKMLPPAMVKDQTAVHTVPSGGRSRCQARTSEHRRCPRCRRSQRRPLPGHGVCRGERPLGPGQKERAIPSRLRPSITSCKRPEGWSSPTRRESCIGTSSPPTCCWTRRDGQDSRHGAGPD